MPSPIRRIGTDDTRVYVATDRELAVLESDSFTGYPQGVIPLLRITDAYHHAESFGVRCCVL